MEKGIMKIDFINLRIMGTPLKSVLKVWPGLLEFYLYSVHYLWKTLDCNYRHRIVKCRRDDHMRSTNWGSGLSVSDCAAICERRTRLYLVLIMTQFLLKASACSARTSSDSGTSCASYEIFSCASLQSLLLHLTSPISTRHNLYWPPQKQQCSGCCKNVILLKNYFSLSLERFRFGSLRYYDSCGAQLSVVSSVQLY